MFTIIINIIIMIAFLLFMRKHINVFLLFLTGFYIFILIGSILCIKLDVYTAPINPFNIYLLTFLYIICILPFKKADNYIIDRVIVPDKKRMNLFSSFYILFTILFIILFLPKTINQLLSGSFLDVYSDMRSDDASWYSNIFEHVTMSIVNNFKYPAIIIGFTLIRLNRIKQGIALILATTTSLCLYSIYIASRTYLFQTIIILSLSYMLWNKSIPKKTKKWINIFILICCFFLINYALAITLSRFAFANDLWILDYFGRSPLTFNTVMEYLVEHSNGAWFIGKEPIFYINHYSYSGIEFLTGMGNLYIDFGYIGFLICLVPYFLFPKKKYLGIAEMFVIFTIFNVVFIAPLYASMNFGNFIFQVIIYVILKLLFPTNKSNIEFSKPIGNDTNIH